MLSLLLSFSSPEKNIFVEEAEGKPMREVGKISVSFTPRVFPTPVRESQTAQEDEVSGVLRLYRVSVVLILKTFVHLFMHLFSHKK